MLQQLGTTAFTQRMRLVAAMIAVLAAGACSKDSAIAARESESKGNRYFAQKRYPEAIIEYRKSLQKDPLRPQARYKLAQAYDQMGDGANAAREYVRSADVLPDDPDAQVRAGLFLLVAGRFDDAKARAIKALQKDPRHVEAHLLLAQATAGLKDIDGAVQHIEAAIRMDPSEPRIYDSLGSLRLAQGNVARAEEAYKYAVSLDPTSLHAMTSLAQFYLSTNRSKEAEEFLKKAIALAPADVNANRTLAALYIGANRLPEAEAPLKVVAAVAPNPMPTLTLADYYFAANRRGDARRVLEPLKHDPSVFAEVRLRLSVLERAEQRRNEAYGYVDEVLAQYPRNAQALLLRGRYALTDTEYKNALGPLKKAVDVDPALAPAHYWLGVAYRDVGDAPAARAQFGEVQRLAPSEVGSKLQLAQLDLLDGRVEAAAALASQALAIQPFNPQAHLVRVDVLVAQNKLPEAIKEATLLETYFPTLPQPHMQLGRILLKQRDYPAAERAFQQAMQLSNGAFDAVGALVDAKIAAGNVAGARTLIEQQREKDPKQAWFDVYAARVYKASHEPAKAEAALQHALANDAGNLQAYLELTRIYIDGKRLDDARVQLDAIVAKSPAEVWARTLSAMILHVQNRKAEAKQRYEKIMNIDPRAAIAANNLATLYLEEGQDLGRALQLAQTAKTQMPNSPEVNDTLGTVFYKRGLASLAIPALELSVRQEPNNPLFQYHLALAFAQTGNKVKARTALERALATRQDFDGVADARRLLAAQ